MEGGLSCYRGLLLFFILSQNTKNLQLYREKINTIKFFNNQATAKLLVFLHRDQNHYIYIYPVGKVLKIYSNVSKNPTLGI